MAQDVQLISPALEFDVSRVVCLRRQLGRAATSLKFIGLLSAVAVGTYLGKLGQSSGADAVAWGGLLVLWCAYRVARRLESGSKQALALAATWCVLWAVYEFLGGLSKPVKDGIDVYSAVEIVMFSVPTYFLARGLFAFMQQRAFQANARSRADPLALHPWEEGLSIKQHPRLVNKKSIAAYWFLVLTALPGLFFLVWVTNVFWPEALKIKSSEPNSYRAFGAYTAIILILGLTFFALWTWAARIYRRARREAMLAGSELVKREARPIVLFLRSFQDDSGIKLRARNTDGRILLERLVKISFEEVVTDHLWGYGPVIAIGNPQTQDKLAPLGAARDYTTDESWQGKVTNLIKQASIIVAVVGGTQGLVWEIDTIVRQGFHSKTVLLLPPVGLQELKARWQFLARKVTIVDLSSEIDLSRTRAVIFPQGHPALIMGDEHNDWTYETVLDEAALIIAKERKACR